MEVTVSQEQGRVLVTVLHVKGDISAATADQFLAEAQRIQRSGARDMLIDLTEVSVLSSAGLRVLHNLFNQLRGDSPDESDEAMRRGLKDGTFKSAHLKLLNPNKNIREALRIAGFDMFLEIYVDLREAVASF